MLQQIYCNVKSVVISRLEDWRTIDSAQSKLIKLNSLLSTITVSEHILSCSYLFSSGNVEDICPFIFIFYHLIFVNSTDSRQNYSLSLNSLRCSLLYKDQCHKGPIDLSSNYYLKMFCVQHHTSIQSNPINTRGPLQKTAL